MNIKRLSSLFLIAAMLLTSAIIPVAATETETVTLTEKVHFDIDFEDYTSTDTSFPKTTTGTYGSWDKMSSAGQVIQGEDGNAFNITKAASSGMYNRYYFTTPITSGKVHLSFDMKYNVDGTAGRQTWMFFNNDSTTGYVYLLGLENPTGDNGPSLGAIGSGSSTQSVLFNAKNGDRMYHVDILFDIDSRTKTFYVDGVQKYQYTYSETSLPTVSLTSIKFNLNANVEAIDNFKLVENPENYSFEAVDATAEDDYVTVKFSDPMTTPTASDFSISASGATDNVSVSEVVPVDGNTYKLKLSQSLTAGNYIVTLTNASLASLIGTTPSSTSATFSVQNAATYFDMDFERPDKFGIESYVAEFDDYGTWNVSGSANVLQNNENRFANDETYGVYGQHDTNTAATRTIEYTMTEPVTDGKLTISFDAAFDSKINTARTQLLYLNGDGTWGNILNYNAGSITGAKKDLHISSTSAKEYEDNKAYRWDTVIDLDNNTITNYCDGVAFNTQEIAKNTTATTDTADLNNLTSVFLRFNTSVTFFDNYKITYNKNTYDIKASDIGSKSNETIVDFGDTMTDGSVSLSFTDPSGAAVVPESVTRITPRRYKVVFTDLAEGTYTGSVSGGLLSALGNTPKDNTFTVEVAERPVTKTEYVEYRFIRQHPRTFDFEGAVASPQTYTDTDGVTKVTYNDTTWKVSGGPDGGHVYALTNTEFRQNGSSSVELRSTDDSTMCAFYANRFWMGKQGEAVSGSVWLYWPSTTTSQYFYLEVANYSGGAGDVIAKSAKIYADDVEKDEWVQIPIEPVEGLGIDTALQVKVRFKGTEPIYVDNLSLGTVEEYPNGYYIEDAVHTIEEGTVTATATVKKRSYYNDGAIIMGAIYDKSGALVAADSFECDIEADEIPVSLTAQTDDFKMAKWFVMENNGLIIPVAESKADRKSEFKILCHNVGKYSHGAGAGVPTADIDEATQVYLDFLEEVNADVMCAQEHAHYFDDAETVTATEQVFGKYYDYNFKSSETKDYVYQGQAIYSKIPFADTGMGDLPAKLVAETEGEETESQRGYTKVVIEVDGKEVAIFNSHLSIRGLQYREDSRDILIEEMNKYEYAILCMDSNSGITEWQKFLDAGYVLGNGHNGEWITTTLKDDNLRNTEDRHFVGSSCIDQILVSPTLEIKNFDSIFNSVYSDHLPVVAEIAFK